MNTEQLFPEFSPISPFQQEILRRMRFMPDDPFPAFIISTYRHHHDDTQVVTPSNQHIDIASSSSSPPVFFLVDLQGVVHAPMDEIYLLSAANNVDVSHCFLNTANEEIPEDETFQSMDFGNVDVSFNTADYETLDSTNFQNDSDIGFQPSVEQNGDGDGDDNDDDDDDEDSESPILTEHERKCLVFDVLRVVADYSQKVADKNGSFLVQESEISTHHR
ncbi:hypothetical protein TSUD_114440 [Trifolium subterraneum]|uniref:Uncharacterized protein n=1 Tax=Trifolium subterraneum TaxID=3900 RepID=A0A2Z6M643_TRISU|nr:hypothetical protein TSUD_114440 [Trifolium subterraneum]